MSSTVLEVVPLAELKPHPRNYRQHPNDQILHLQESLREHGVYRNVVCARDGTLLAGHGVVAAARGMGLREIAVCRLDLDPNEPRALKVLAGDNEIAHLGEGDDRLLSELLKEISETDAAGLLGTGYDAMMLANLAFVTRPASEIKDFDEAAHWAGMPEYRPVSEPAELRVRFADDAARLDFAARLGLTLASDAKTLWWPEREREDVSAIGFR